MINVLQNRSDLDLVKIYDLQTDLLSKSYKIKVNFPMRLIRNHATKTYGEWR